MKVFLLRHAIAEDRELYNTDSERPLTDEGRKKLRALLKYYRKSLKTVDKVISSPYLRASQTADEVSRLLNLEYHIDPRLVPDFSVQESFSSLEELVRMQAVLFVGHEPHLSSFACYCLTGGTNAFLQLKKAGLLELEFGIQLKPGAAQLLHLSAPRHHL